MITVELGDYFSWKGQVVKCHAINTGQKAICFMIDKVVKCPDCGASHVIQQPVEIIEQSPLFQENAKPLQTAKVL